MYEYLEKLDSELAQIPLAVEFEKRTGLRKSYAALGLGFTFLVFTFLNWAGSLLSNFAGFIYPTYASLKAIESRNVNDDTSWLTYWVIFGFFTTIEYWSDKLLTWFPFYYFIKSVILLWLYLPMTQGATVIYASFIRPTFLKVDSEVDRLKEEIISATTKTDKNLGKVVSQTIDELEKAKSALGENSHPQAAAASHDESRKEI